jgi:tetratricopeptide (TPR) repeat protein
LKKVITITLLICSFSVYPSDLSEQYDEVLKFYKEHRKDSILATLPPAENFLDQAKSENSTYYIVKGHFLVAYIHSHSNNFGKAIVHYLEAARFAELSNQSDLIETNISIHKNLAGILEDYNHYDLTHRFNDRAIQLATDNDLDHKLVGLIGVNKSSYLIDEGKYVEALNLIDSVFEHLTVNERYQISLNNKKGVCLKRLHQPEKALKVFRKAITFDYHKSVSEFGYALRSISEILSNFGQYDSALYYLDICEEQIIPELKNDADYHLMMIENIRASVYIKSGDIANAEACFAKLKGYAQGVGMNAAYHNFYQTASNFYQENGNIEEALAYQKLYSDALSKYLQEQRKIEELDKKYNIDLLTERYFDLITAKNEKQRAIKEAQIGFGSVILLLVLIIIWLITNQKRTKSKIARALKEIEMESEV